MKCAVLKPNDNGSGGNVGGISASCMPGYHTAVQYPDNWNGYATNINQGEYDHPGFTGAMQY